VWVESLGFGGGGIPVILGQILEGFGGDLEILEGIIGGFW
jgi:hypothetical protein